MSPDRIKASPSSAVPAACTAVSRAHLGASSDEWLTGRVFVLLLALAIVGLFPKVLLGLDTFFYRDFSAISYPQAFYERQSFLRFELPLWNPYIFCGVP